MLPVMGAIGDMEVKDNNLGFESSLSYSIRNQRLGNIQSTFLKVHCGREMLTCSAVAQQQFYG